MRALWSGVIQFGLIVLPVKLFSATDEQQVRLREIHAADNGRVQHRRFCEAEDREIRECGGGPLPVWMAPQALFCGGDGRDRPGPPAFREAAGAAAEVDVHENGLVPGRPGL